MPQGKTKKSIAVTRHLLTRALGQSYTVMVMARDEILPEDVEDTVMEILKYLEKTAEES